MRFRERGRVHIQSTGMYRERGNPSLVFTFSGAVGLERYPGTYPGPGFIPVFIILSTIGIHAVIDYLQRRQGDVADGLKVLLPIETALPLHLGDLRWRDLSQNGR